MRTFRQIVWMIVFLAGLMSGVIGLLTWLYSTGTDAIAGYLAALVVAVAPYVVAKSLVGMDTPQEQQADKTHKLLRAMANSLANIQMNTER